MNQHKQHEQELVENEIASWMEQKLGYLKPYWSQIALAFCVVFLAAIAVVYLMDRAKANKASKWQQLGIAQSNYLSSLDNSSLKDFANEYPDDKAGFWAMLFAADAEMRSGLADMAGDRKAGFDKIIKAQEFYRQIVDSNAEKSTMLQRRSVYGLAYSLESGGKFDDAAKYYQQLVDLGKENPFADDAARGLERSTNPVYAKLFEKFRTYEAVPEAAPGMSLPQRPDFSFPDENGEQPTMGGGDFGSTDADASTSDFESDDKPDPAVGESAPVEEDKSDSGEGLDDSGG